MSLEIGTALKLVCEELRRQVAFKEDHRRHDFIQLLNALGPIERCVVARYFCNAPWNIGGLKVLSILQQLRLLTASEYILSLQNAAETQLILNDFFEGEHELLANVFSVAHYDTFNGIKLNAILDDSLGSLFIDLLLNPALNDLSYLNIIRNTLPSELLPKLSQKHINIILDLHSGSVKEAFQMYSTWINDGVNDINFTKQLYDKLLCHTTHDVLSHLFKLSTKEHFKNWKFYLILLQTIASKCAQEFSGQMRKHLKVRLRQIAAAPNKVAMLHLLLTARATTATTIDVDQNIDAYAKWYKEYIGEMKFVLKTEEFQNILALLEQCIEYEQELEYLEIHATISISPPVLCGKMVQTYKSRCKAHLTSLKGRLKNSGNIAPIESIFIEDSD